MCFLFAVGRLRFVVYPFIIRGQIFRLPSLIYQVECSTSFPGGNQVDGLPPASSPGFGQGEAAFRRFGGSIRGSFESENQEIRRSAKLSGPNAAEKSFRELRWRAMFDSKRAVNRQPGYRPGNS